MNAIKEISTNISSFKLKKNTPMLTKKVGKSQYTDGVRIDEAFHKVFNPSGMTKWGKSRDIKILFNDKVFDGKYVNEGQARSHKRNLQSIRYRADLKREMRIVFPEPVGSFSISLGVTNDHFIFIIEVTK